MKLQLLLLTTVISMITERRVEAQMKCYENRDGTGTVFIIADSTTKLDKVPRVCDVSGKYVVIFYSEENYLGEVNALYSFNGQSYRPRLRFTPKSVLIIGKKSPPTGLFLFRHKNYAAGLYKNFIRDDRNVQGAGSFQSAIIIGTADWKVVRNCDKSNYNGECWSCLEAAEDGRASFIQDLKIGSVMEDTIKAYKKNCIKIKSTGLSSIPECQCNQFGTLDGPDKCNGNNGICLCNSNFTGDDCDSCSNPAHTYREGRCVAGCGCYTPGKSKHYKVARCYSNGQCKCDWARYDGLKCELCYGNHRKNFDGLCVPPESPCWFANLITKPNPKNKFARRVLIPGFYNITTGYCKCKKNYVGHCDECAKGFYRYYGSIHMLRCFTKAQYDKVMELKKFHDAGIQDYAKMGQILLDLKNLKALSGSQYRSFTGSLNRRDWIWKPIRIANALLYYHTYW